MSSHRFFLAAALPDAGDDSVVLPLTPQDAHHAVRVLRIRPGEKVEVVEPDGGGWLVQIEVVSDAGVVAVPVKRLGETAGPKVVLVQGLAKGEKMDVIVRQAVEVGVDEIVPVLTHRSIVRLDARKSAERGERLRRIARSAAEQSHRDRVPVVLDPLALSDALPLLASCARVVVLWEDAESGTIREALGGLRGEAGVRIALVVGPEGGLDAEEVEWLVSAGALVVSLGSGILRTETAAVVAASIALHELGGLGNLA
jgi:16S rRNA (uracil1498-N3)-methyltransferase